MQELALSELASHEILKVSVDCTAKCALSFELTRPTHEQLVLTAELRGAIGSLIIYWVGGRVSSLQKLDVANNA